MEVAVLVPWAPADAHRVAAWGRLRARHLSAGRTVIEGSCDGPWCKALAVADALHQTDAELLVIHDADVWTDGLDMAIAAVEAGQPWAMPHHMVWRLAEGQHEPTTDVRLLDQDPYPGYPGGGVVVVSRDVYEDCPLDPRFVGWGQEDEAFALALTTLHGQPWRGEADLWHWWHPPQERESRFIGNATSKELRSKYRNATRSRDLMTGLIEEARWATSRPTTAASRRS